MISSYSRSTSSSHIFVPRVRHSYCWGSRVDLHCTLHSRSSRPTRWTILTSGAATTRMHACGGRWLQFHPYSANNGGCCSLVGCEKVCGLPWMVVHRYELNAGRVDVGGKLLTNHLKELVSFRQWNMMEETHIMNDVKERCCFVSTQFAADLEACRFALLGWPSRVHATYQPRRSGVIKITELCRNTCFQTSQEIEAGTSASLTTRALTESKYFIWVMNASQFPRSYSAQTT